MRLRKYLVCFILVMGTFVINLKYTFAQDTVHLVKYGDTFWKIGHEYGINTVSLMRANNANENTILYPGQKIIIPTVHVVQPGESYWTISHKYKVDFNKLLFINNANSKSMLYIGEKVFIPSGDQASGYSLYTVQKGDTYWILSKRFNVNMNELLMLNGANEKSYLYVGQVIKIPLQGQSQALSSLSAGAAQPYVTYLYHTVQKNDTVWSISVKYGIPFNELMKVNNFNSSTVLQIGDKVKVPVHHIPIKNTPGEKYGELLDWWSEAQYVIPIGSSFEVADFYTGKSFFAKRTTGSNHADCEALTMQDTNKIKEIWGGKFSWERRPVIVRYSGRKIAASMTAMPHAGNDSAPGDAWTSWRSGDYGAGINYDYIKGNGMDGHFDMYFSNCTRHKDGRQDPDHQKCVEIAAGIR